MLFSPFSERNKEQYFTNEKPAHAAHCCREAQEVGVRFDAHCSLTWTCLLFINCMASSVWLILFSSYTGGIAACFVIITHGARLLVCHEGWVSFAEHQQKKRVQHSIYRCPHYIPSCSTSFLTIQIISVYLNCQFLSVIWKPFSLYCSPINQHQQGTWHSQKKTGLMQLNTLKCFIAYVLIRVDLFSYRELWQVGRLLQHQD